MNKLNKSESEIRQLIAADPSYLTTQNLWREIAALKELLTSKLDSVEKAIDVAHDDFVRVPTEVQKQIGSLKELLGEKINNVDRLFTVQVTNLDKQFELIEKQRIEQKADTRTAVDDALRAAKESVFQQNQANNTANSKSEASFSKQIDQQAALLVSMTTASNERINDLKERLAKAEGRGGGLKDFGGWIFGAIAILFYLLNYLKQ